MKNKKQFAHSSRPSMAFEKPNSVVRLIVRMPQVTASQPWSSIMPRHEEAPILRACLPSVLSQIC